MSYSMKIGDLEPPYTCVLLSGNAPVDLTGCTVQFRMTASGSSTPKVNRAATIVGAPTAGRVRLEWVAGDTDTIGNFNAEWVVTSAGRPRTYPSDAFLQIKIVGSV